ncbi:MAG: VWA domain-containing protein [Acidobacteria bacterium]|nr:VWA domain-containing protein [Acidobacteriota bacterium]
MVTLTSLPDRTEIALKRGEAVMDRDFILTVKAPQSTRSFAMSGADGDGTAAIASFQPLFPGLRQPRALNLAIVIDCSGSMQGDSITQARLALDGILRALQPRDRVAIVAFGEKTKVLSDRLLPCNEINLAAARQFAAELQADMGGTEISHALDVARAATMDSEQADLFVVTDGEVSAWEGVVGQARHWKRRVFTVGVGNSVTEAFVRQLAEVTGGACELVSPQEGMADRVIRHFERMRAPHAKRVVVHWPEGAHGMTPKQFGAVFEGDTVMASAQFSRAVVAGAVALEIETDDGDVFRQEVAMAPAAQSAESAGGISTVARLAASARLGEPGPADPANTAVRYQLISDWTNWLVIAERAEGEKAQGIPAIRKVQQTMAAGWGGVGSVMSRRLQVPMMDLADEACMLIEPTMSAPSPRKPMVASATASKLRKLFTRAPRDRRPKAFRLLLDLIESDPSRLDPHRALQLLHDAGLLDECQDLLQRAASLRLDPEVIAALFLARLVGGPLREFLSPSAQRGAASLQDYAEEWLMRIAASRDLFAQVEQRVHDLSATPAGRRSS